MVVTSENVRKIEEQQGSHAWGNTHTKETHATLREFNAVFAQSKSASETGVAIRGRGKNSPRRAAVNMPLRNQNQEKGMGGGKIFLHFMSFWTSQLPSPCSPNSQASLPWGWEE